MAAALIPMLISAIMGSGRNKKFDPADPTSEPYEERKTGMGRFLQRYGSGVDSGEANNEYRAKRFAADEAARNRQALLEKEYGFRGQLEDKRNTNEFGMLKSRLDNQAALTQYEMDQRRKMFETEQQNRTGATQGAQAQRLFELTGTWDPMQQQEILRTMRERDMNAPRPLGGGQLWLPEPNELLGWDKGDEGGKITTGPDGTPMTTPRIPGSWNRTSLNPDPFSSGIGGSGGSGGAEQQAGNGMGLSDKDREALLAPRSKRPGVIDGIKSLLFGDREATTQNEMGPEDPIALKLKSYFKERQRMVNPKVAGGDFNSWNYSPTNQ